MLAHKQLLCCVVLACASQMASGLALPRAPTSNSTLSRDATSARVQGLGNGVPLRIMPLGASITYGFGSSDKNGYRKTLRDRIVEANGNKVNMVGDNPSGSMRDNDTEGWKSYTVDQVRGKADAAVPKYKPNVVLVNVGTNDCVQDQDLANAGGRLRALLDALFRESPRATVVLSTLLVNRDAAVQRRVEDFNAQLRKVGEQLQAGKKRLVVVDMQSDAGPQLADLNSDGTHPGDGGYRKMADVFYAGLKEADRRNYFVEAEKVDGLADDGA
ncbi:carbohydrate esterase family 3 protein [Daldinia caldariorum]|uniref:carbohydrate esterase family 3 protein n=1 Tax=Daldinia caldariorum TaxID=326644 RepID=UPI00200861D0|nr:carbohydrate esterase family 3 protein [Daldinia caldariorum]KAI1468018.1 carbohydrate esterase family 3 protein [Daldinia caldariorum]